MAHALHLYGTPIRIVAADGYPVPGGDQSARDTVTIAPGEGYDVEFVTAESGQWPLPCNVPYHTTNDGNFPGGMMEIVGVM